MITTVTKDNFNYVASLLRVPGRIPTVVPVFRYTDIHPKLNSLCLVLVALDDHLFEFGYGHPDIPVSPKLPPLLEAFTPNSKDIHYTSIEANRWIDMTRVSAEIPMPNIWSAMPSHVPSQKRNDLHILPVDVITRLYAPLCTYVCPIVETNRWVDTTFSSALHSIEAEGLYVKDTTVFASTHVKSPYVYSQFNMYNKTGRVTNAFGGYNFSAINKHDGSRANFTSRFGDKGTLIEIDFEAFHLHLISRIIGYEVPKEPFHQHLAKQYFQTDEITDEQYEEGKKTTFRVMYAGLYDQYKYVPFFGEVHEYLTDVTEGHRDFPITILPLHLDPTDAIPKQFSYVMQNLEAAESGKMLADIVQLLYQSDVQSRVVLYTYDSFLLDMHQDDLWIMSYITQKLTYPYKVKTGHSYDQMV